MKEFRIYYKNGNTIITKAYSLELVDGKVYGCARAGWGNDQGVPYVLDGKNIERIEEL